MFINMLDVFSITDRGRKRKMNQDYIYVSKVATGNLPNLMLLADGMGGHKAGDYASKHTIDTICGEVNVNPDHNVVKVLTEAIKCANTLLYKKSKMDFDFAGMGTTLVAATCDDKQLIVANVGDSRLYLARQNVMVQVTKDHSYIEEMRNYRTIPMNKEELQSKKNCITRAIGAEQNVEIDFFYVDLKEDDIILICSDGLTNMLSDEEILYNIYKEKNLEIACTTLVDEANKKGGADNISVILAHPFVKKEEPNG
ncbi:MAG: Stp1/IreP family PP2C-type Ser/Thr phosphatase [Lachnospiraceae bacterium]